MSRKIEDLDQRCQDAARKTLDALTADDELRNSGVAGWLIVETRRELATQMAYFARGRMAPDHVRIRCRGKTCCMGCLRRGSAGYQ